MDKHKRISACHHRCFLLKSQCYQCSIINMTIIVYDIKKFSDSFITVYSQLPWSNPIKYTESESEVAQSCLTLCDTMDCNLPGSSVHGILRARILEWVTISFSRGSSQPRDWTQVSHIGGRCFNLWATREDPLVYYKAVIFLLLPDQCLNHYTCN